MTTKKKLAKDTARQNSLMQKAMARLRMGPTMRPFSSEEINAAARSMHLRLADIREGVRLGIRMMHSPEAHARLAWFQISPLVHPGEQTALPA